MKQHSNRNVSSCLLAAGLFVTGGLFAGVPRLATAATPKGIAVAQDGTSVVVTFDGRCLLKYRYGDAPFKPYVKELCTPDGVQILRDSPADHVHHRGLMYGLFVDGVDFWSEREASGKQVDRGMKTTTTMANNTTTQAGWNEKIDWLAPGNDAPLLTEQRDIAVCVTRNGEEPNATLLTWHCRLQPRPGHDTVEITGTHYDGLGMRFVESMDQTGHFFYQAKQVGPIVRGTERVTPSGWAAYTASVDDKPITVAIFSCPANPRSPAGMFTMLKPFAYLSATPNVWKNPLVVRRNETLDYCYGVAVCDGAVGAEQVEQLYERWLRLSPNSLRPSNTPARP